MSSEHRLTTGMTGLYGKHPGFGDFVAAGLPEGVLHLVSDWLQNQLGAWREVEGEHWQAVFDNAPMISFWIGPALVEGQPLRGVWAPSRDRGGRRFPLMILQCGGVAPVLDSNQDFYSIASLGLGSLLDASVFEPRDAAERLQRELPMPSDAPQADWPIFWALNPAVEAQPLLAGLATADHAHAASTRSYWWFSANAGAGAGVLACQGLPGPAELGWMIAGGVQPAQEAMPEVARDRYEA